MDNFDKVHGLYQRFAAKSGPEAGAVLTLAYMVQELMDELSTRPPTMVEQVKEAVKEKSKGIWK